MARHAGLLLLCALVLVCVRADDWDDWDDWEPTRPSSNTPASASQTNPAPASAPKPESKSSTPSDDDWSDWGDWGDETASAPKQPPPSPPPPTKPPAAQSTDNDDWDDWGDEPAEPKQQPPAPAQHSQSAGASNDNWDDWGEEEQAAPPPAPKQPPPSPSPRSSDTWDDWDDWGEDAAAPPSPPPTPAPSQKQTTSNSEGKHDDWDDWGDGDATAGSSGPSDAAARASTNEDDIDDDEGNEPMTFDVQGPGGQVFTLSIRPRDHLDTAVSAFCTKHGLSNFEQLVNHVRPHYEARAKDIGPTRGEKREQEDPEFWNPNIQFNFWMPPRNLQVRYRRDEDFEQRAQAFVTEHRLGNHMVIWLSNMLEVRNRTREYQEGFVAWMQESYRMYEGIPARAKPGAKKYFLDLGSRTAEFYKQLHNFWFFEGFEFFLFECNPRMSATVRHAVKDDPHATFLEKAVWTEDGTMKFWIDNDPQQADHGSSLFEDHAMVEGEELMSEVETVDFSKWLGELATVDDLVVVRMDIEGAEYEVLKKLIVDGNAKLIDHLDLEYHAAFAPSLRKHLPADKVLPWILEGYGTTVKTGDYYSEIQCEKNADGEEVCINTSFD